MRLLTLVQDNQMINTLLSHIINSCGFSAVSAFDGMQALAMLSEHRVDAIFMDVRAALRVSSSFALSHLFTACHAKRASKSAACRGHFVASIAETL
jgi:CheY-like chemotaxis protein